MTTLTGSIDPAVQAAADQLKSDFQFPPGLRDVWQNIRLRRCVPRAEFASPTRFRTRERQPRPDVPMAEAVDAVEDEKSGICSVAAKAPSDEELQLPTAVAEACTGLSPRRVRLARAVASVKRVKVLEESKGLRDAMPAVLTMLRERGAAERILLVVPEKEARDWKTAALQHQDEINVTCFVKAAVAEKNCVLNLEKCRKPGLVVAAREFLEKNGRIAAKVPRVKLFNALKAGGASRWELVLYQCTDADLTKGCEALSLLENDRADGVLFFGPRVSPSADVLTERGVRKALAGIPDVQISDDIRLMAEDDASAKKESKPVRSALHPIEENVAVPKKRSSSNPKVKSSKRLPKTEVAIARPKAKVNRALFKEEERSDIVPSGLQGISKKGRFSPDYVRKAVQKSLRKKEKLSDAKPTKPKVLVQRRCFGNSAAYSTGTPNVSIDAICEQLRNQRMRSAEKKSAEKTRKKVERCLFSQVTSTGSPDRKRVSPARGSTAGRMASPITIPSLSLEVIELDNSDEEWKPPPESDEDGVINISSDSDTDNAMPRSRGGSSSSKTSRRSSTFSSNKSSDKHLRLCDAQRKKPKSPLKKRKDVPKARKNALHQLIAQTAEKSKLKTPEPGSFSRRMGESSSCMRQTALSFNKKPPTYETSSQRPRDSVTTPKRGRRRSFNKDAVTAFAAKGVLPDDERVKYNQMMEKAKWAEERGDDKAGLKWYFKANRVSEHDEVLANRIRSFGPPALQQLKDERSSDKKQNPFASLLFPEQSPLQIRQQRRENMQTKGARQRARNATLMHPAPSPLQTRGQRGQRKLPATGKARPAPVVICLDD